MDDDESIDIWLYSRSHPGVRVSASTGKASGGMDKIRVLGGMAAKGATRGQFATTSTFTDDAVST